MPGFVLLVRPRGDGDPAMRIGITVSGKVGNAVIRNRMKRRFRELARAVLPEAGIAGADHILIGRPDGIERDWTLLREELIKALRKLQNKAARPELVEGPSFASSRRNGRNRAPSDSGKRADGSDGAPTP